MSLLQNGRFEQGTWKETFNGEVYDNLDMPEFWVGFWREGEPHDRTEEECVRPEARVIEQVEPYLDPPRIYEGKQAWQCFTFHAVHDAGLYQRVEGLEPGRKVRAQAWTHAWSSQDDDPFTSDLEGASRWNFEQFVGLDPTGGTDPWAESVVWGEPRNVYDIYRQTAPAEVEVGADGAVTVFVRSTVQYAFKHCDCYWDAVTLEYVDDGDVPPTDPGNRQAGKVGPHIIRDTPTVATWAAGAPALALAVGSWNVAQQFPGRTTFIGRVVQDQIPGMFEDDPHAVAEWFVEQQREIYEDHPDIQYWAGPNEFNPATADDMAWLAEMEADRIRLMVDLGTRQCAIFNFSTGRPPLEMWAHAGPALAALDRYGGLIGLHEYSSPVMDWLVGENVPEDWQIAPHEGGWTTLRYRLVHHKLAELGYGHLQIAITECGLDYLKDEQLPPGASNGPWRNHADYWAQEYDRPDTAQFYAEQLEWYGRQLAQDDYVVGAALFCEGHYEGSDFADFDVAGTPVVTHLTSLTPDEPEEPEEPGVDYVVVAHLLPQDATLEEKREAVEAAHEQRQSVVQSARDAARLVAPGLAPGSKVVVWDPERWTEGNIIEYLNERGVHLVEVEYFEEGAEGAIRLSAPTTHIPLLVTSPFGVVRERADGSTYRHSGTDYRSSWRVWGDEIVAAAAGKVKQIDWRPSSYGLCVTLDHGGYETFYAHLIEGSADHLEVGQRVRRGDVLGRPGNTGASSGDHLHFGLRLNGQWVDPHPYLAEEVEADRPSVSLLGVHDRPVLNPPPDAAGDYLRRLNEMGIRYLKVLEHHDDRGRDFYESLVAGGIIPISRLYVPQLFPERLFNFAPAFKGVIESRREILENLPNSRASQVLSRRPLVELWNEPNLPVEWSSSFDPNWHDDDMVRMLARGMMQTARIAIGLGARVGFPAMAPTERAGGTHPKYSSLRWARGIWDYWMAKYKGEVKSWVYHGDLWIASHSCMLLDKSWSHDALATGDDMSPLGYQIFKQYVVDTLGLEPWLILTEAGPYSPEHRKALGWDERYDDEGWADAVVSMEDLLNEQGDVMAWCPWYLSDQQVEDQAWLGSGWVRADGTERNVVSRLKDLNDV
jgi:murein DD-endopeptidase MepM/ murein hydrolase activator NlpD